MSVSITVSHGNEQLPSLPSALKTISLFDPTVRSSSLEKPIFILAAGWRSGSTLLQRLVISSGEALIWGEPYGAASLLRFMTESLQRTPRELLPERILDCTQTTIPEELTGQWIANLYPQTQCLLNAHANFWDALLMQPAQQAGYKRWGFKDVRIDIDQAEYLKWLYPNAKFVLLYRNPFHCYVSYKRYNTTWYETWPDSPLLTPNDFGRHWNKLVSGFLNKATRLNSFTLRFENLISTPAILEELSEFLELKMDPRTLYQRIAFSESTLPLYQPSASELEALRLEVSPTAEKLDYFMSDAYYGQPLLQQS